MIHGKCTITWFNQIYIKGQIKRGQTYRFFGRIAREFDHIEMRSPVFDELGKQKNTGIRIHIRI